jgi:hypothetical protein
MKFDVKRKEERSIESFDFVNVRFLISSLVLSFDISSQLYDSAAFSDC